MDAIGTRPPLLLPAEVDERWHVDAARGRWTLCSCCRVGDCKLACRKGTTAPSLPSVWNSRHPCCCSTALASACHASGQWLQDLSRTGGRREGGGLGGGGLSTAGSANCRGWGLCRHLCLELETTVSENLPQPQTLWMRIQSLWLGKWKANHL